MTLTDGQRTALANLARKKAGQAVDWITIADARALTDLGLAERVDSGWRITAKGETEMDTADHGAEHQAIIVPMAFQNRH